MNTNLHRHVESAEPIDLRAVASLGVMMGVLFLLAAWFRQHAGLMALATAYGAKPPVLSAVQTAALGVALLGASLGIVVFASGWNRSKSKARRRS